jgi:hypothetical protein
MLQKELITKRFEELDEKLKKYKDGLATTMWHEWATSVLYLLENVFGVDSVHVRHFREAYTHTQARMLSFSLAQATGVFYAAKADYDGGYIFRLENTLSGEILGDFVTLAKATLQEGNKDAAAALASAALEDALKRYARQNELIVDDKEMQAVVGALKSKGLVSGAQKTLLDTMPKLRDYAMHANWDKLTNEDVGSIIGFVEQFLLSHFS